MNKTTHDMNTIMQRMKGLKRAIVLAGLILAGLAPAWAAKYVFVYNNGYLSVNNSGQVANTTTFSAGCVWTCVSSTSTLTETTLSTTSRYLYTVVNGTRYWMVVTGTITDGMAISVSTTAPANAYWRNSDNRLFFYNNTTYYVYYRTSWKISSSQSTRYNQRNNQNLYYAYTTEYRSTTTAGTNQAQSTNTEYDLSAATISPSTASLYNGENQTFSHSEATMTTTTVTIPAHAVFNSNQHYYYGGSGNAYLTTNTEDFATRVTGDPSSAGITYEWSLSSTTYATVNQNTGVMTVNSAPATDQTVTLTLRTVHLDRGLQKYTTATVHILAETANPEISLYGTNQGQISCASDGATIYYTLDGSTPDASSTVYSGPFTLPSNPTTVKAIAIRNGHASGVVTQSLTCRVEKPSITIDNSGLATVACATEGATIYYTTDGSTPTTSSATYSAPVQLSNPQTIKAIAVKSGYTNSEVATADFIASGVGGGKVILDDREDHAWSYYSDPDCPIRSLSPADVKITYYGDGIMMNNADDYTAGTSNYVEPGNNANYVGGAKTNVGENENTFIYFKTLERGANTQTAYTFSSGSQSAAASRCPYTTIPNPFQVRPTYGTPPTSGRADWTGWRGFQCWRLKSVTGGAVYSAASGGTALALNAIINAETEIYFAPNSEYGMEVELEAVWAIAYLVYANGDADWSVPNHAGLGYERNFVVLASNKDFYFGGGGNANITDVNRPSTISPYLPNGTSGNNQIGRVRGNNNITLQANTKFENVQFTNMSGNTMTAAGFNLIVGRGCSGTVGTVRGLSGNQSNAVKYTICLESGTYGTFALIDNTARTFSSTVSTRAVFGSDYDRAKSDNEKLSIAANSTVYGGNAIHVFNSSSNRNNLTYDWLIKSGRVQASKSVTDANADESIYIGNSGNNDNTRYMGKRRFIMEGGEMASLAGSLNTYGTNRNTYVVNDGDAVEIRIKGGTIRGSVYGAAAYASATGNRRFLFTGGEVRGWIAGGANGTQSDGGYLYGSTKIYIGGNTSVNSNSSTSVINRAVGGNVFGAGCGYGASSNSGQVTEGTTVVVADDAYVERGVYGGGSYGYTTNTSNVYILGGHVEGKNGGVNGATYSADIAGGVYGGACQNQGGVVNITMTGGLVEGGLYGGSNTTGTVGSVTMHVDGGQVGTPSQHANIHGGGYGYQTVVTGDVNLTLGSGCAATDGVTVYGDVYGGSAEGQVNGTSAQDWYTTNVSLYKGTIYGGLYGGGLGSASHAANVNGPVTVKVYGGSVRPNDGTGENGSGGVFGCNNVNGTPTGTVTVDLYGTDPAEAGQEFALYAVYGGGNRSNYTGTPVVTIHGCDNNIEYVYGGGNASDVAATNVTIWGGHIGNAFGGGNGFSTTNNHTNAGAAHYNPGANITTGGTHLTIHGGQVDAAFGGSNQYGRINGGINVTVVEGVESGNDPCSGNAYAACANNVIGELYGGGNQAPAQTSGGAFITPSVTISSCDMEITNLFGGAKAADHGADINLVITKGKFQNVFGGNNLGGTITGNVTLTLNGGTMINAFGGNNQGGSITGTITVTMDSTGTECPLKVENVYGGGNMAAYEPSDNTITSPVVNIVNGTVRNAVFGGGLGSAAGVTANPQVTIGGTGTKHVFVGGRLIDDSDDGEGNVYGGGSQAEVVKTNNGNGNTHVILTGNAHVKGNVYGGGNQADVQGNTNVELR